MLDNCKGLRVINVGNFDPSVANLGPETIMMTVDPSRFGEYVFGGKPKARITRRPRAGSTRPCREVGQRSKNYTGFRIVRPGQ